jgi:hypothetical protein
MSADETMVQRMAEKYREGISKFINWKISAEEFESTYLRLFKHDKDQVSGPEFDALEKLFFAVDDYVADPSLRKAVNGLDEEQLRGCARDVYQRLYLSTDPS